MPFRIRKSIKVAPGVRLNVSKSGVGVSVGTRGARYSLSPSGRRTVSVGIPGSGIRYTESVGGGRRRTSRSSGAAKEHRAAPAPVKPGFFAPKGEKKLYKAVQANDPAAIREIGQEFPDYRLIADGLVGLLLLGENRHQDARAALSAAMAEGADPAAHPFVRKYMSAVVLHLSIAPGVRAEIPFGRDAVGMALAKLHQETGELGAAIGLVEHLEPSAHAAVLLAELYVQAGRYQAVIDLTDGLKNIDDSTALLCVYRGVALREEGYYEASRAAFKEALKTKARKAEIRHLGLSERAYTYLAENKKAMARKDLERILAEDASYGSVRERLSELAHG